MQQTLEQQMPCSADSRLHAWPFSAGSIGLAVAVAIAYFFAARLSLALLTKPDDVAMLWPAAGVAAGTMIALGRAAWLPVAVGVMAASIAANVLGDRNLGAGAIFALCNAGESILIAWLIERWFGSGFSLDSMRRVLGLYVAAGVGTAVSGIGGTAGFVVFHNAGTAVLTTWLNWFASDALGVVTVAPLVIGFARTLHDLPEARELVEGTLALAVLSLVSAIGFGSPTAYWFTILPLGLLLPLLLWPAARCRPVFAAAAAFILATVILWTITFGQGRLGDPNMPLADRVNAARAALLVVSVCALFLAALFAEKRCNEAALKDSNDRLQLALDGAELGVWSIDLKSGRFENDTRDSRIYGHRLDAPPKTLSEARSHIHPDDLPSLDAAFVASARRGGSYKVEYRLAPVAGHSNAEQERWIAVEGTVVPGADGRPDRLLGVTRDITERKQAEEKLRKSERELRELLGALPAAIYVTDAVGRITYFNQAAVDLAGRTPNIGDDKWCISWRLYRPDGSPLPHDECPMAVALKEDRPIRGAEAIAERPDGSRVSFQPFPTPIYDPSGKLTGAVNMLVDITEIRKAERVLAERNLQLALAGKAALVGSYAYDVNTERMQVDEGYAALHGLPEGTVETTRSEWRVRAHPKDLDRVEKIRQQAFCERRGEYGIEYRIVGSGGKVQWIGLRSFVSYSRDGRPQRVVGVNIDITERKRVEDQQRILVAELDHRVKNVLATVQAVAAHTMDASSSMEHFVGALDGRIRSMGSTHELLSERRWRGIPLAELVERELAPYTTGYNTELSGPDVVLSAEAGQAMGMMLHELVTNAAKYGALSNPPGRVLIRWHFCLNGNARDQLAFEWQETGGPLVVAPGKSGYGTCVIREIIPYELGGTVDYVLALEGVRCRLDIPVARLNVGSPRANGSASAQSFVPSDDSGEMLAG